MPSNEAGQKAVQYLSCLRQSLKEMFIIRGRKKLRCLPPQRPPPRTAPLLTSTLTNPSTSVALFPFQCGQLPPHNDTYIYENLLYWAFKPRSLVFILISFSLIKVVMFYWQKAQLETWFGNHTFYLPLHSSLFSHIAPRRRMRCRSPPPQDKSCENCFALNSWPRLWNVKWNDTLARDIFPLQKKRVLTTLRDHPPCVIAWRPATIWIFWREKIIVL
jgi:hypothetical protein